MTLIAKTEAISSYDQIRRILEWVHLAMQAIAMGFNFIILLSMCWCKRPIKTALYFPMSLALADGILMATFSLDLGWRLTRCVDVMIDILSHSWILIPILHIVEIEFTIWYAVAFPDRYTSFMTGKKIGALVLIAWFGPITLIVGYFGFGTSAGNDIIGWDCKNYFFVYDNNWRIILAVIFSISLMVILLMDIYTFVLLKKFQQQQAGQNLQFGKCQRYVMCTFHGILISYLVGWAPYCVTYFILCEDCVQISEEAVMISFFVTKSLVILKALFSPFLYALRFRNIREALVQTVGCCGPLRNACRCCVQNSREEAIQMDNINNNP
ncbi:unnamed protein product [Allacma fusca]|uniref:G-protein coupled receptors family 1 profile domain-containing protein n=1 Tax=Allacma fusca TaxID=39272 RepID=A0A8J2JKG6_9HEXA|nr:unnamed protein product [Allacma fusca]